MALADCPRGDEAWREALGAARAEERLEELLERARELSDACPDDWEPAWTAGECLYRLRPPESADDYREALRRARLTEDATGVACSANRLGGIGFRTGVYDEAEAFFREALTAAEEAGRADLEAFARNNYAGLLLEMGRHVDARNELERAAAGLEALGMTDAARAARYNRATIFLELGDAVAARDVLHEVQKDAAEAGDEETVHDAALSLGKLELALGAYDEAATRFRDALDGPADTAVLAGIGLGRVALAQGDHESAHDRFAEAAERAGEQGRLVERIARARQADAAMRAGRVEQAQAMLEEIDAAAREVGAEQLDWVVPALLGKLRLHQGDYEAAIEALERATTVIEQGRADLDPAGSGLYFLRERADVYVDLAAAIAASSKSAAGAERVLRIARAVQARALRHALSGKSPSAGELDESIDLTTIQRGLRPGELLLNYLVGEDRGLLLAIGDEERFFVPLPGRGPLAGDVSTYGRWIRSASGGTTATPDDGREAGVRLRRTLLDAVRSRASGIRRLYVVPDRELALLPFAALPLDDGSFVGQTTEIALLPMAAPPPRPGARSGAAARRPVLLAGGPDLTGSEFAPLPWSSYELSELRSVWGEQGSRLLHGTELTQDALTGLLTEGSFPTLHLATHAVASSRDPRKCGVILSGGEHWGIDAIVDSGIDLGGEALVTLSACRTGVGELVPGEGVIGLVGSFFRAGARAVVASYWTVSDDATARLMIAFHRHLADGEEPVRALALASRELPAERPEYADPVYWAPFTIQLRP